MEGRRLNILDLEEHIRALAERFELTLVEGAGGLMVPIEERLMMIDLVQRLGLPAVLVARARLGTLNHTLLSVEALKHREIPIAAIVVSSLDAEPGPEEEYTPGDLMHLVRDIPVLRLPYLAADTRTRPDQIAQIMSEAWPKDKIGRVLAGKLDPA
jgi:dethiobiotin synthetase